MFALLVVGPQLLHWLDLDEFRHCFESELVGKRLVDHLELPIFGIEFEVVEVLMGGLDEDHEVDLVLLIIFLFNLESFDEETFEIFLEGFVHFVVFALSFMVLLVHLLDPLSELPHDGGLDLASLQLGLLEGVDQLLRPLLGGFLCKDQLRLFWLGRKVIFWCCGIHMVHKLVRICLCFLDLEQGRRGFDELNVVGGEKAQ